MEEIHNEHSVHTLASSLLSCVSIADARPRCGWCCEGAQAWKGADQKMWRDMAEQEKLRSENARKA